MSGQKKKFIYGDMMKNARKIYKSLGIVPILFLILFGVAKEYVFVPVLGKLWGLALKTTPDGYLSEGNILRALVKSPWIILCGLILLIIYVGLAVWQISAVFIAVDYSRRGKGIRLKDLVRVSFAQLMGRTKPENLMLMVYGLIITPAANFYQVTDMFGSFIVPEYIQDFINAHFVRFIIFAVIVVLVIYIALRWLYILPAFVLRKKDFKEARRESRTLTEKQCIKNGINIIIYSLIEFIRLSIIPVALLMLPVFICYCFTKNMAFSQDLYVYFGVRAGLEIARICSGTLVSISIMCLAIQMYFAKLKENGMDDSVSLPETGAEAGSKMSIIRFLVIMCSAFSVIIAAAFLVTVRIAQTDSRIILELFGRTEIIAHKGYSSRAPENTMPAFELADRYEPVTLMELDVRSTKDGIPVVIHNENIMDATGIDKSIYECTYDELQELQASYDWSSTKFADTRIPALEEVIAKYGHSTPLLIEIKYNACDPELPAKIVRLMKKYGCEDTCVIQSGNYAALRSVKETAPEIRCGLILTMVTGNYYDLPYADFFSIEHTFVGRKKAAVIHRRRKQVFAWTVNYDESIDELRLTGVDGIITDYPENVASYVSGYNDLVDKVFINDVMDSPGREEAYEAIKRYEEGNY